MTSWRGYCTVLKKARLRETPGSPRAEIKKMRKDTRGFNAMQQKMKTFDRQTRVTATRWEGGSTTWSLKVVFLSHTGEQVMLLTEVTS